jgi:hypothetical protein
LHRDVAFDLRESFACDMQSNIQREMDVAGSIDYPTKAKTWMARRSYNRNEQAIAWRDAAFDRLGSRRRAAQKQWT